MTIYKPKPEDKKSEKKGDQTHSKVTIPEDLKPLATKKKPSDIGVLIVPVQQRWRRKMLLALTLCFILMAVVVLTIAGFVLFRRVGGKKFCTKTAQFRYYEYQPYASRESILNAPSRKRIDGLFTETVELDLASGSYERIDVPPILKSRRSTVLHDFETNWTAIADHDNSRCFVMPLNRHLITPPKNFLDLMEKYETGYYLPDAELVRAHYKVQLPAVIDLAQFGIYITYDCRSYTTYRLVQTTTSLREKRSSCDMAGDSYCLGDYGTDQMLCIELTGCM